MVYEAGGGARGTDWGADGRWIWVESDIVAVLQREESRKEGLEDGRLTY